MKFPALSLLLALGASLAHAQDAPAAATEPSPEVSDAIRKVFPALVLIHVVMEEGADGRMKKVQGAGSGTILTPEGHVVTNHHVAGRGTRFVCVLSTREEVDATLVGTDPLADLAVLKLDLSTRRLKDQPVPTAAFGDSSLLRTGDVVYAMGSPGGLSQSVTRGIVANTEMIAPRNIGGLTLDGENVGELVRWIGHDAVIYPGNSGGPLVNPAGEVIGVNEVGIASLGGAIPANLAKKVVTTLIQEGRVVRSWIGLEVQPLLRRMTAERGVLVATVWPQSPAAAAGVRAGDFITSYGGVPVPDCRADEDIPVFNAMVLGTAPGTEVVLGGTRGGQPQTWTVRTEEREPTKARESELREWGMTARDFTRMSALEKSRTGRAGVLVDSVRTGGPMAEAKPALRAADVLLSANGTRLERRADLVAFTAAFVKDLAAAKPVLVEFEREGQQLATVVKLGPVAEPVKPLTARRAWLGASVQVLTDDLAEALGVRGRRGVRLTMTATNSPARKAGLKEGDLLWTVAGKSINARRAEDADVFAEMILACAVDSTVELTGQRDGQPQTWSVMLAARPVDDGALGEHRDELFEFTARQLSARQRDAALASGLDASGVAVAKVEPNGWAALGGLVGDDVILSVDGEPTPDVDSLRKCLAAVRETRPRSVVFAIRREARTRFLEIEPRW